MVAAKRIRCRHSICSPSGTLVAGGSRRLGEDDDACPTSRRGPRARTVADFSATPKLRRSLRAGGCSLFRRSPRGSPRSRGSFDPSAPRRRGDSPRRRHRACARPAASATRRRSHTRDQRSKGEVHLRRPRRQRLFFNSDDDLLSSAYCPRLAARSRLRCSTIPRRRCSTLRII